MQLEAHLRLCQNCLRCYPMGRCHLSQSSAYRSTANYYERLGVKPDASLEQIRNAFVEKSKKIHPDRNPSDPKLHGQFVELNEAYRVLSRDASRKEYDLRFRRPYYGAQAFRQTTSTQSTAEAERIRYWEQFSQPYEPPVAQKVNQRKQSFKIMGYCVLAIFASLLIHYFGYRKLEKIHMNFMEEKDRVITQMYNEAKERARVNGFQKQMEILHQRQAEFMKKHKAPRGEK